MILRSLSVISRQISGKSEKVSSLHDLRIKFEDDIKLLEIPPCAASWSKYPKLNPASVYRAIEDMFPMTGHFKLLRELSLRAYEKEGPVALTLVFSSPLAQWFSKISPGFSSTLTLNLFTETVSSLPLVAIPGMLYVTHTLSISRSLSHLISDLAKSSDAIINNHFDYLFTNFVHRRHEEYQYNPTPLELEYFYIDPHNHSIPPSDRSVEFDEFGEVAGMYLKPSPMFRSIADIMCAYMRSSSLCLSTLKTTSDMRFLERIIVSFALFSLMSTRFKYSVLYAIGATNNFDSGLKTKQTREEVRISISKEISELSDDDPLRMLVEELMAESHSKPLNWHDMTIKLLQIQRASMYEQSLQEDHMSDIVSLRSQKRQDMLKLFPEASLELSDLRDEMGFAIRENRRAAYEESAEKGFAYPMSIHGFRPNDTIGIPPFQVLRLFLKFITIGGCRDLIESMSIEATKFASLSHHQIVKATSKAFPTAGYITISILRSLIVMLPTWLSSVDRLNCLVDIIDASSNFLAWSKQRPFLRELFRTISVTIENRIRSTTPSGTLAMMMFRLLMAMESSRENHTGLSSFAIECIATTSTPLPMDVLLRAIRGGIITGSKSDYFWPLVQKIISRACVGDLNQETSRMLLNFHIGVIKARNFEPIVELSREMISYYKALIDGRKQLSNNNDAGLYLTLGEFITLEFMLGVIPTYITHTANDYVNEIESLLVTTDFRFYDDAKRRLVPYGEVNHKQITQFNDLDSFNKFKMVQMSGHLIFCLSQTSRRIQTGMVSKLMNEFIGPAIDGKVKLERLGSSIIRSLAYCQWTPTTEEESLVFSKLCSYARSSCFEVKAIANHRTIAYLFSRCLMDCLSLTDVDLLMMMMTRLTRDQQQHHHHHQHQNRQQFDGLSSSKHEDAIDDDDDVDAVGDNEHQQDDDDDDMYKTRNNKSSSTSTSSSFYDKHIHVDLTPNHMRPLGQILCFAQHLYPQHDLFKDYEYGNNPTSKIRNIIDQTVESMKSTSYSVGSTTQRDMCRRLRVLGADITTEFIIGVLYADAVIKDKKIVIEFHGPIHFPVNDFGSFSATTNMKNRLFKLHGYKVLHISFKEFELGMSAEVKWKRLMDFVTENDLRKDPSIPFLSMGEYMTMDEQAKAKKSVENQSIV